MNYFKKFYSKNKEKAAGTSSLLSDSLIPIYSYYCKPRLVELLTGSDLNVVYKQAEGNFLYTEKGNSTRKILDLVGGFGANLLGHNNPEILQAFSSYMKTKIPFLAQGSLRGGAALLAEKFSQLLGRDFMAVFTNTGTETVEAALKHAFLEKQKEYFLSTKGSFHGKTLGSIQLTWTYSKMFKGLGPRVLFLDPFDKKTWKEADEIIENVAGIFFEPLQGEGGIIEQPPEFLEWIKEKQEKYDIPLIADEIQSGLGRTGTFLASEIQNITPDYICFSKSLGGGICKIGVLLIDKKRFIEYFSIIHTSTFAEDDYSCLIALKVLEIIVRDNIPELCRKAGNYLLQQLTFLKKKYPDQIKDIRGKGLMIGIEFRNQQDSLSNTIRALSENNLLGYAFSSYLLNVHNIRVLPTLSSPNTIRIEPSAYIKEEEFDQFLHGLEYFCQALQYRDVLHITWFEKNHKRPRNINANEHAPFREKPVNNTPGVAFLGHLIRSDDARIFDPSLKQLSSSELSRYLENRSKIIDPVIFDQVNVRSKTGKTIHLNFIGLGLTSKIIETSMRNRNTGWIVDKIEKAVLLARESGCSIIGLGGYTSILAYNGLRLRTNDITITTGNALTVGMGLLAIEKAAEENNIILKEIAFGVVGASGNIGKTYALLIASKVKKLILIVRNCESQKSQKLLNELKEQHPELDIILTEDYNYLKECSCILSASNSEQPVIFPRHLAQKKVIICDVALPPDVSPEVENKEPDIIVIKGGIVKLFNNDQFRISGIPLEKGHAFACMSETILMGLEKIADRRGMGQVKPEWVLECLKLADQHGFTLGKLKTQKSF